MEDAVEFDPAVAGWEGALIPRRPLQEPHGSAADWKATGTWADGEWTVDMWRTLETEYPADTKQLQPGEVYTWSPAVHHGAGKRWHWVAYPDKLGLGVEPDSPGEEYTDGPTALVAQEFTGGEPNWESSDPVTIPLVFPGVRTWDELVSDDHPRATEIRNAAVTVWELYEKDPGSFVD